MNKQLEELENRNQEINDILAKNPNDIDLLMRLGDEKIQIHEQMIAIHRKELNDERTN